ncbi:hypothetical protein PC116_g4570 [Phytophthora cactorum]|uniref:Uncharacterized protein n=1 Tax=Phytophthora cactorum TaxID=29920 RepID=A0A329SWC8_9STRA|nr:hypothetical protein C6341_g2585 [Phytophthora cactorum]KAG4247646.1 hypothetical protein PC116_g4570 [Phytophthora cactorum]RAW40915.1 hypothetical protein PC110_g2880 [Phytophthora cactorum]
MMEEMGTISFGRSADVIKSNKLLHLKRQGKTLDDYEAVMKRWTATPNPMDYWFPASSVCETIATGELVTGQAKVEHFCFLKLTKAPRHECDEGVRWKLANLFLNENIQYDTSRFCLTTTCRRESGRQNMQVPIGTCADQGD